MNNSKKFRIYPFGILLSILMAWEVLPSISQDLETITQEDPVQISGSVNATGMGYLASGIPDRRDPFNWFLTGNLNLSIYGWNAPFSFSYSNQNKTFRQPFNQYGISPYYKWIRLYIGYHNLNYSAYSLAGHVFLGGAMELTPGKWSINMMYGRLNKAVEGDSLSYSLPAYRQMGWATKIGYGDEANGLDVILFHAKDDTTSLSLVSDELGILPMENLVISVKGRKRLTEQLSFQMEWAHSALTRDLQSALTEYKGPTFLHRGLLFSSSLSSEYYKAIKGAVLYMGKRFNTTLNYERVDPGYRTLGAYFFNNDLVNITIGGATRLWSDRIDVSVQLGKQRNNLQETEVAGMRRTIASIQVDVTPHDRWSINSSYSNFTSFTNVRPRFDPYFQNDLDTLNFYQINQTFTSALSYSLGSSKEIKQGIFVTGNYQRAREASNNETASLGTDTDFYSWNMVYRYAHVPQGWSLALSVTANKGVIDTLTSLTWGPNLIGSKTFFNKRLRVNSSIGLNRDKDYKTSNRIFVIRTGLNYTIKKSHQLALNIIAIRRSGGDELTKRFSELTSTFNYTYAF